MNYETVEHEYRSPSGSRLLADTLNRIASGIHTLNAKWWIDPATGLRKERNFGEMLMLATSELSEALEAHRKDLNDDKLVHRKGVEVEIADAIIRLFDTAAGLGMDLGGAFVEKVLYNMDRADHKLENRLKDGGKKY